MIAPMYKYTAALKGDGVQRKPAYFPRFVLFFFAAFVLLSTQSAHAAVLEKSLAKLEKTQNKLAAELQHYFKTGRMADKLVIRGLIKRIDRDIERLLTVDSNPKALKEWAQNKSHINRLLKKGRANLGMPRKELNKVNVDFSRLLEILVAIKEAPAKVSVEKVLPSDVRLKEEVRFSEEAASSASTRLGAEQARLDGDALQAKEGARLAAEAKAASESKTAEEARLAAEAKIAEQVRVDAAKIEEEAQAAKLTEKSKAVEVTPSKAELSEPTLLQGVEEGDDTPVTGESLVEKVSIFKKIGERFKKERTLGEALTQGDSEFGMRFRYEDLNNGLEQDNSVVTFRSHWSRQTKPYRNFSFYGELEDVRVVGGVDLDTTRVRSGFASVGNDADTTEINQAFLLYSGFEKVHFSLGRQRIVYGNGRFVGNAPWRQNERTYDSFTVQSDYFENIVLEYAFIDRVRTTQGGVLEVTDHVFNATYLHPKWGLLNAYGLLLSDDVTDVSSVTAGARLQGEQDMHDEWQVLYAVEIAAQLSASRDVIYSLDLTPNKHAIYTLLEGGAIYMGATVKGAYEVLRSDEGKYGFDMLLGSDNKFNGWTDTFSTIPIKGLRDFNVSGEREFLGLQFLGEYHLFSADSDGSPYGREIDLMIAKQFDELNQIGIKLASYQADGFSSDLSKFWFWLSFRN